jgi:hypothetical protein
MEVLDAAAVGKCQKWFNGQNPPEEIRKTFNEIMRLQGFIHALVRKNRSLMGRLREFMGLSPKSEKGSQLNQ